MFMIKLIKRKLKQKHSIYFVKMKLQQFQNVFKYGEINDFSHEKMIIVVLFQSFTDDVARQEERERDLQRRFQELYTEREELV